MTRAATFAVGVFARARWRRRDRRRPIGLDPGRLLVGLVVVGVSAVIYWIAARGFDAGRGDFFYLADAFLHGRTWLTFRPGPNDVIVVDGRIYVPFAPFPAVALMPVVAVARGGGCGPGRIGHQRRPGRDGCRAVLVSCWPGSASGGSSTGWS